MKTYLIVSKDKEAKEKKVTEFKNRLKIKAWNLHVLNPDPSIGIDKIRRIKELTSLKPYSEGCVLIVLNDFHKATREAQNAMLKLLEEPPENIFFLLTSVSSDKILPTVISRCQIVKTKQKTDSFDLQVSEEKIFWEILKATPGERIVISETLGKSKEEALHLLDKITLILQKYLHQPKLSPDLSLLQVGGIIKRVEMAKTYLERNINYKATLDILFLGFPQAPS